MNMDTEGDGGIDVDESLDIIDIDMEEEMQSDSDFEADLDPSSTKSAFEQTTENLIRLSAISLDRFRIKDGGDYNVEDGLEDIDVPFMHALDAGGGVHGGGGGNDGSGVASINIDVADVSPGDAPKVLRDIARKMFGGSSRSVGRADPIKYEVLEEKTPLIRTEASSSPKYFCILTIFRPTGSSRSYRTPKAEFSKRSEAKAAAAHLALQLGAIEFMRDGDKTRDRIHLVPLGKSGGSAVYGTAGATNVETANGEGDQPEYEERDNSGDAAILEIENCCTEWRSGSVRPQWIYLIDNRFIGSFGCALKISLSAHVQRAYSVVPGGLVPSSSSVFPTSFPTKSHAKSACAKLAIAEGVLDFIKHGDGLEQPVSSGLGIGAGRAEASNGTPFAPAATVLTLQAFYDSLPKPMPDSIGTKMNGDFNAIPWLHNIIQTTKGSRMSSSFHWFTDAKVGLHGCLLRLTRPDGPSKTYMVDASFSKRSDAKIAACLWACSQGINAYAQQVAAEIDSLVTPEMRRRGMDEFLPTLGRALNKIRPGLKPDFSFVCDLASFSCTLTIDLSAIVDRTNATEVSTVVTAANASPSTTPEPSVPAVNNEDSAEQPTKAPSASSSEHATAAPNTEITQSNKTWITRTKFRYKTKQDARIAAVYLAFEEGVMQWVEEHRESLSRGGGEGKMAMGGKFGSRVVPVGSDGGGGRGWGRGRGGFERAYRGQTFGKGFDKGRNGFSGRYGFATAGHSSGHGGAEFGRASAGSNTDTTMTVNGGAPAVTGASSHDAEYMELEEGEMVDGRKALGAASGFRGKGGRGFRARGGAGGLGFRRGRGGNTVTVPPIRSHSQVAPHINPRFFPHINGIPASSYPQYQPGPPLKAPAPFIPGYSREAYMYDYNPAAGAEGYAYEQWHRHRQGNGEETSGYGHDEESRYQHNLGYVGELPRQGEDASLPPSSGYSMNSGNNRGTHSVRQRPATESAHHGRQLDTADAASNAVTEPQLVPSSVGADNGRVELGGEANPAVIQGEESDGKRGDDGKESRNRVVTSEGGSQETEEETIERKTTERSSVAVTRRVVPAEAIPSGPRATRNRHGKFKVDARFDSGSDSGPSPGPGSYPSDFDYSYQSVVTASPTYASTHPGSHHPYPYSYQQHQQLLHDQSYEYYNHYYSTEALPPIPPPLMPQVPVYNAPYPYPGDSTGMYLPTYPQSRVPTQPTRYPYPPNYVTSSPDIIGFNGPAPPSGPRAMLSRNPSTKPSSGVQGEGRKPPSAPRAMMEKYSQSQGKLPAHAKGRQERANIHIKTGSSLGKRSSESISERERKRPKVSSFSQ